MTAVTKTNRRFECGKLSLSSDAFTPEEAG
jgi:hypothetical protein